MKESVKDLMYGMGYMWHVIDPDWKIRLTETYVFNLLSTGLAVMYIAKGNKAGYLTMLIGSMIHLGSLGVVCKADDIYLDEEWKKEVERLKKEGKII